MNFTLLNKNFNVNKSLENYMNLYNNFLPAKNAIANNLYSFIENYNNFKRFPYDIEEVFKQNINVLIKLGYTVCVEDTFTDTIIEELYNTLNDNNNFDDFYYIYYNLLHEYRQFEKDINISYSKNRTVKDEEIQLIKNHFSSKIKDDKFLQNLKNKINKCLERCFKTFTNIIYEQFEINKYLFIAENNLELFKEITSKNLNEEEEIKQLIALLKNNPFDKRIYIYIATKYTNSLNEIFDISQFFHVDLTKDIPQLANIPKKEVDEFDTTLQRNLMDFYKYLPKSNYKEAIVSKSIFLSKVSFLNLNKDSELVTYFVTEINQIISNHSVKHDIEKFDNFVFSDKDVEAVFNRLNKKNITDIQDSIVVFNNFCSKYGIDKDIQEKYIRQLQRMEYEVRHSIYNE